MIERKAEDTVITIGESNQKSFQLDLSDLRHIVSLMIDQYSDIRGSIVRELISNMYDSGGKEVQCIVGIHENYIYFQDINGPGMSKDFMLNNYTTIGFSSKRNDSTKIGAKGIGRLSALSYTGMYRIICVSEGIKCEYLVFLDSGIIKINLNKEEETTEPNGTRVEIQMKNDSYSWESAIQTQCCYFPNLVISTPNLDIVNNNLIQNDLFIQSPLQTTPLHICFGIVRYDLDWDRIDSKYRWLDFLYIGLKFGLDSGLIATPSRESLMYDDFSIKIIEAKLEELITYLQISLDKTYTTKELFDLYNGQYINVNLDGIEIDINNVRLLDKLKILDSVMSKYEYHDLFPIGKLIINSLIEEVYLSIKGRDTISRNAYNILLNEGQQLPKGAKEFLVSQHYKSFAVWKVKTSDNFYRTWFNLSTKGEEGEWIDGPNFINLPRIKEIVREYVTKEFSITWDSINEEFLAWKEAKKTPRQKKLVVGGDVNMLQLRTPLTSNAIKDYVIEPISLSVKEIQKDYRFVLYTLNNFPNSLFESINSIRNKKRILICKLNKTNLKFLMDNTQDKLINIDDLNTNKDLLKILYSQIIGAKAIQFIPYSRELYSIINDLNPLLHNSLTEIRDKCSSFSLPSEDIQKAIIFAAETLGCIDREIFDKVQIIEKYRGCFDIIKGMGNIGYRNIYTVEQKTLIKEYYFLKLLHKGFKIDNIIITPIPTKLIMDSYPPKLVEEIEELIVEF